MTEYKHTPGPYLIEGETFVYALNEQGTNVFGAHVQRGWKVNGEQKTDLAELAATAQLFSAAPDLLEALVDARDAVASALRGGARDWFDTDEKIAQHVSIRKIDAAIAKATA